MYSVYLVLNLNSNQTKYMVVSKQYVWSKKLYLSEQQIERKKNLNI